MLDTTDIRGSLISHRPAHAHRTLHRLGAAAAAVIAAAVVLMGSPGAARADDVPPDGKGIAGGALLGGEVVTFVEAIAGVRSVPAYLVGAGAGAVAGGVGGYFVEQAVDDGRVPAYMLAGGLCLIIPALVVALDQTRYLPTEGAREDRPVNNLPPADPGQPGNGAVVGAEVKPAAPAGAPATSVPATPTTPAPATTPPPVAPPAGGGTGGTPSQVRSPVASLFNLRASTAETSFRLGVPLPQVRPLFSANQKRDLAVDSTGSEVRFPLLGGTF